MKKRFRKIVKIGGSTLIQLTTADVKDYDLEIGDFVDISEIYKLENSNE